MTNPSWYNNNQFRDYPFITRTEPVAAAGGFSSSASEDGSLLHLPHAIITDFGAIMEIDAEYAEDDHTVYLYAVSRSSDTFTFNFRTTAPYASNHQLVFTRELLDDEHAIEWEDAASITAEPLDEWACSLQPRWRGFLVTGSMTDLADLLSSGEQIIFNNGLWVVEPARIQSLAASYLRSISLANAPRLRASGEMCSSSSSDSNSSDTAATDVQVIATCITGNVKWKEGYNCNIRQDNNKNAIIVSAGVGLGEGEPCEEVPRYTGEEKPADSRFYSGGPACNEVVKSINGVSGTHLTITAGTGIIIEEDVSHANTLIINKALSNFIICLDTNTDDSSSNSSSSAPG